MSNICLENEKGPSPPPAPPLPLQTHTVTSRARSALARFAQPLLYGSRLPKPERGPPKTAQTPGPPVQRSSSPIASRSTAHQSGTPIAALDISPSRTHAIVAGREILKTIRITDSNCTEDNNLRAAIIAYAATHETASGIISAKHKDQLAANDVKWSHGAFETHIATAAPNGQIVVYDIYRAGMEVARLHEHRRQVHRLGFNPHQGAWMLSGSQDATIKLWDLRSMLGDKSVMTCDSKKTFAGHSDGVRDLRWSPTDGFEFAVGTDNGGIQRWDIRKPNAPLLRMAAHDMTCNSIDWHPGGKYLASGGADKNIKVWDFSSSDRRMKPAWQLKAPQAVINVRWRPVCWSLDGNRLGKWQCTQLASSYDKGDSKIHVWDLRRPSIPFRVLNCYDTPPSAFLWHSENLLWSVGPAGMFTQTDMRFTSKTLDHRSPNAVDIAADGQILLCSMKRNRKDMAIEDVTDGVLSEVGRGSSTDGKASGSHSATHGSLERQGSFYSSIQSRRSKHLLPTKFKASPAATSLSMDANRPIVPLEEALHPRHMYKPQQIIAMGYVPGLFDADAFRFCARHYKAPPRLPAGNQGCNLHLIFSEVCQHNARVAAYTGQHRLSQTWEVLGVTIKNELEKRAESNRRARIALLNAEPLEDYKATDTASNEAYSMDVSNQEPETEIKSNVPHGDDESRADTDLSNNLTTDPAAPVRDYSDGPVSMMTTNKIEISKLSNLQRAGKASELGSGASLKDQGSDDPIAQSHREEIPIKSECPEIQSPGSIATDGSEPKDIDRSLADRQAAAENYRSTPRPVLKLGDPFSMTVPGPNAPSLKRQESHESFQIFSASTDSSQPMKSTLGSFEHDELIDGSKSAPGHQYHHATVEDDSDSDHKPVSSEDGRLDLEELLLELPFAVEEIPTEVTLKAASPMLSFRPLEKASPIINFNDFQPLPAPDDPEELKTQDKHGYIGSDFSLGIPDENPPPFTATAMLLPLIEYHAEKLSDAQFPAWLLVHVVPYFEIRMNRDHALNIVLHYHKKLTRLELYIQAAELRNFCADQYPEVSAYGLDNVDTGGPYCTQCRLGEKKSRNQSNTHCDNCHQAFFECPICVGYGPISPDRPTGIDTIGAPAVVYPQAGDALWGWCQACGHGGHVGCLSVWFDDPSSEGGCPTMGCLCDCAPGSRRDEILRDMESEEKSAKGPINRDTWSVGESEAVRGARGMMGSAETNRGARTGILQTGSGHNGPIGLGTTGRSASGGKKVRIVVPEERPKDKDGAKGDAKSKIEQRGSAL